MAPDAPRLGTFDKRHHGKLREGRRDAADQIKQQKPERTEIVLDVVAENPEIEHIAENMQPAAMHEHGGEDRLHFCGRAGRELARHKGPCADEVVPLIEFEQKHQHIHDNQQVGDNRHALPRTIVVPNRKNHRPLPLPDSHATLLRVARRNKRAASGEFHKEAFRVAPPEQAACHPTCGGTRCQEMSGMEAASIPTFAGNRLYRAATVTTSAPSMAWLLIGLQQRRAAVESMP